MEVLNYTLVSGRFDCIFLMLALVSSFEGKKNYVHVVKM